MVRQSRCYSLAGVPLLRAILFALLVLIPLVGYSDDALDAVRSEVSEALARGQFDPASQATVERLFSEASAGGIPPELLLARLQEGVAKRVDAALIIQAVEAEIEYLTAARDIVSRDPEAALIVEDPSNWFRAANFLRAGQPGETLLLLGKVCADQPETFRPATLLYLSLSDWGIDGTLALELVEAVVVSDLDPAEYPEVTGLLSDAQRSRMDLADAVDQIAQLLHDGRSLRQITRILRR